MNTTYSSDLTDAQWACLQRHLPSDVQRRRWTRHSLRGILDLRIDYERKVQTSETLIEVAMIRLLVRRLAWGA